MIATVGGGVGDGDDGMGGDATEELARTCNKMKALVIELAMQACSSCSLEPSRLEGALASGPSPHGDLPGAVAAKERDGAP
jgi:hypothetical protein